MQDEITKNSNLSSAWVEWKHISIGLMHCETCLKLDECWFLGAKKPRLPQHPKCHCFAFPIANPISNVTSFANCPLSKISDYIFNLDNEKNKGKKKLFEEWGIQKKILKN